MPPNSYVFSGVTVVKNLPTNAGDAGSASLIPGSGRPLMEEMATYSLVFLPGKPHGQRSTYTSRKIHMLKLQWVSLVAQMVKNLPANAGDARDSGLIPGSGRSLGVGNGNPLQYSCLENLMDRGAWLQFMALQSQTQISSHTDYGEQYGGFSKS